ncbi:hypothetical protein KRONOS_213 [Vibrio phage Kronos]|nr:hypothetical protein DAX_7 [Vibrio phage Dax]QKN84473.1 hypothetical protein BBMUFFIN_7 [Vibrio phage BBMuffin]WBF69374.1 hypothetical protein IW18_3 [Vibrio phage IW18]WBU76813.1 hypothetical protein KRONOS_7 [Vibrio phage Kronos]QKE61045.1 hypothetical protein DAX_208 [Vibrio phage Dax]
MITITELTKKFVAANNDDLAAQNGMVYQLWSDGEITLQKSGDLLGKRTLHCIKTGVLAKHHTVSQVLKEVAPHDGGNGYGFIYCNDTDADLLRDMIRELA